MSHKTYGHGKTRIDLNGPYGTVVSLFRIADYWANLCNKNRLDVALFLTDPNDTMEHRYAAFAEYFGDYATLYYGDGKPTSSDSDPFSAWPFECRRGRNASKVLSEEEKDLEDNTVEFLIGRYLAKTR